MEGTLRLDLRVEEYTGCFVNIDEYELPNGSTLLDREVISSVILVRIGDKSDGTILV